jgi:predicted DNA binding protein
MAKNNKNRTPKTNKPKLTPKQKKAAKKAKKAGTPAISIPKPPS